MKHFQKKVIWRTLYFGKNSEYKCLRKSIVRSRLTIVRPDTQGSNEHAQHKCCANLGCNPDLRVAMANYVFMYCVRKIV